LMMNPVPWLQMTNMISYQGLVRTFPKRMGINLFKIKRTFLGESRKLFWSRDRRDFLSNYALSLLRKKCRYQK
ncbi:MULTISPECIES: hypothetical protein, partial [Enterobacterales]